MKILFDHQVFIRQQCGGISNYFTKIFEYFDTPFELQTFLHSNIHLKESSLKLGAKYIHPQITKLFMKQLEQINMPTLKHKLSGKNSSYLFHPTDMDNYWFNWDINTPIVITVHDLIPEVMGKEFIGNGALMKQRRLELIKRSDRIIAISKNTKNDLIKHYNISEHKIDVIYHGSPQLVVPQKPIATIPDNYLLFVGERRGYKNFQLVVEIMKRLSQAHKELHLICTGKPFRKDEKQLFEDIGLTSRIHHYRCSNQELSFLYQNALAMLYPSKYEGFGLPILEAFTNQCTVVASDKSCIPEVAGDAAILLDPTDVGLWVEHLSELCKNQQIRESFIKKGLARCKSFTWEKTAKETEETYRKAWDKQK